MVSTDLRVSSMHYVSGEISQIRTDRNVAELSATAATLGQALHPRTAANLAGVVRITNTYYSNLIEGHNTRPNDIERALAGKFDDDEQRRNLQIEAAAHVRVQAAVDRMTAENRLSEPASVKTNRMRPVAISFEFR